MKFIFTAYDEGFKVEHDIEAYDLFTLLDYMQSFLRGCGYEFDGRLGIESDNEFNNPDENLEGLDDNMHYEVIKTVGLGGITNNLTTGPVSVEEITKE